MPGVSKRRLPGNQPGQRRVIIYTRKQCTVWCMGRGGGRPPVIPPGNPNPMAQCDYANIQESVQRSLITQGLALPPGFPESRGNDGVDDVVWGEQVRVDDTLLPHSRLRSLSPTWALGWGVRYGGRSRSAWSFSDWNRVCCNAWARSRRLTAAHSGMGGRKPTKWVDRLQHTVSQLVSVRCSPCNVPRTHKGVFKQRPLK